MAYELFLFAISSGKRDRFESMLISAARDADVQLKLIESRGQSQIIRRTARRARDGLS